mmetsp:Transcript_3634/g.9251  ORF Transcript_3634/g.9251 Transcript_3634/m.9251 type:complete len:135 (-) Transcript_3634:511-915(-)
MTDLPLRLMVAEITREKIFLRCRQEIPYQTYVETTMWKNLGNGGIRINQTVYVQKESQKGIMMGAGGTKIKAIGSDARQDIMELVDKTVHLFLHVKVDKNWKNNKRFYEEWGLDYNSMSTGKSKNKKSQSKKRR